VGEGAGEGIGVCDGTGSGTGDDAEVFSGIVLPTGSDVFTGSFSGPIVGKGSGVPEYPGTCACSVFETGAGIGSSFLGASGVNTVSS